MFDWVFAAGLEPRNFIAIFDAPGTFISNEHCSWQHKFALCDVNLDSYHTEQTMTVCTAP